MRSLRNPVFTLIVLIAISFAYVWWQGKQREQSRESVSAPPMPASPIAEANTLPPSPVQPRHYYSIREGFEYGYEQGLSDDDVRAGKAAASIMMWSYLGQKDGAYQVMSESGDYRTVAECRMPCEFVRLYGLAGNRVVSKDTLRITGNALIAFVFADALGGRLEQRIWVRKAGPVTYWVDGDARKLVAAPQEPSSVSR